jgi:hypothetical protein
MIKLIIKTVKITNFFFRVRLIERLDILAPLDQVTHPSLHTKIISFYYFLFFNVQYVGNILRFLFTIINNRFYF